MTLRPAGMVEAGLDDARILEAVQVIGRFNRTNRVGSAPGFVPDAECHAQVRARREEVGPAD